MASRTTRKVLLWLNHLDLRPGDPSVTTSFDWIQTHGLVVNSSTTGDTAPGGGNKVVATGIEVPPGWLVTGVRVCYQLSNARTHIDQIRLAQTQHPPGTQLVILDDPTAHSALGPVCVDSQPTSVDPAHGAIMLSLRLAFGDTGDGITIRALGLHPTAG